MTDLILAPTESSVLDSAHVGDIRGALGTIKHGDTAARHGLSAKFKTLLAIVGPGLIVMCGDNDAGAFSTYGQSGQNYGTRLLWVLLLLVPVLYVNQEMVVRLGAVTGVGHGKLIMERFGRFWGAFSVIDLFLLNALTLVTEFIGITLAVGYLGLPKVPSVLAAGAVIVAAASTGSFRRFERVVITLCAGSLLLIPIALMLHPSAGEVAHGFLVPQLPGGGQQAAVMLLIIGLVGTTVAPWQLFFQQSYVIDKRITPRFIKYEKADLWIGIVVVVVGAAAIIGFSASAVAGTPLAGHFSDAQGLAQGIAAKAGHVAGILFAIALLDSSIIGAFAVSLSTAYAAGDTFGINHSLHRGVKQAKGFYAVYVGLIGIAATVVLIPGSPLGLITNGVQALAGVLLPSASVYLLVLCNDRDVLGPWVNGRKTNLFTGAVLSVLVTLSLILTLAVLDPKLTAGQILDAMSVCGLLTLGLAAYVLFGRRGRSATRAPIDRTGALDWRMPPLAELGRAAMPRSRRIGMTVLRLYLALASVLVVVKIVEMALRP
ncbi:MAG: NRAMP family divalent metal transporter [Actinocrinis sp.]